jgi:extradiol dioxygenase family protein
VVEHPFHLAVQVRDLEEARMFYRDKLGFAEGRSASHWIDFDMFGHQLVVHLNPALGKSGSVSAMRNEVDGDGVSVPHFGVVLTLDSWDEFRRRVEASHVDFVIPPKIRFPGEIGEQRTMFFLDPSANALEFKAFANREEALFAR